MERSIKFLLSLVVLMIVCGLPTFAVGEPLSLSTLITSQNVTFDNCIKVFNTDNSSLFFLTLAAINANRFDVDEIQSNSGYILFTAVNKQFLATISNVNTSQGLLKITPVDGLYYFQPGICSNIFKYIDLNISKKPEVIF